MTEAEFNKLYWDHSPHLMSYSLRILKVREDAEDIIAEVFIRLWQSDTSSIKSMKDHLFICTRNACVNFKSKANKVNEYKSDFVDQQDAFEYLFEDDARAERVKLLIDTICTLPKKCKDIMLLSASGYKSDKIAEVMGIAKATVKRQKVSSYIKIRQSIN